MQIRCENRNKFANNVSPTISTVFCFQFNFLLLTNSVFNRRRETTHLAEKRNARVKPTGQASARLSSCVSRRRETVSQREIVSALPLFLFLSPTLPLSELNEIERFKSRSESREKTRSSSSTLKECLDLLIHFGNKK